MKQVNIACFPIIRPWLIITGVCWYSKYLDYTASPYIFFPRIFALLSGNIQVYRSKAKIFQAKRIFIKFDRNNKFFLHLHKKKNDKEFKTSLSLYHRMKWKCLTVKRERQKNNVKSRNGKSQDTLFLEKRILFHSFFQTLNWRSVSPSKRRPSCKAFSSRNARE